MATLRNRLDALEAKVPSDDTRVSLILRTFVDAIDGRPGRRDDWDAPPPEGFVWLSGVKYSAEPGETAAQAAERLAKDYPPIAPRRLHVATLCPVHGATE